MPEKDEIQLRHEELLAILSREEDNVKFWKELLEAPRFQQLIDGFEKDIDCMKEQNTSLSLKTDQTVALRAEIAARRAILQQLRDAADDRAVIEAKQKLSEFQDKNAIFFQNNRKGIKSVNE